MPRFGQMWFNGYYFGTDIPRYTPQRGSIKRAPAGCYIRRTINKTHVGGTRHEVYHTVGGIKRVSIYYTGETWITDKAITFRVVKGNGFYGTKVGKFYQQKYKYYVPSTINNANGQPARDAFKEAVLNWQTTVTEDEKIEYNRRAALKNTLSGYNLYIGEYVEANA